MQRSNKIHFIIVLPVYMEDERTLKSTIQQIANYRDKSGKRLHAFMIENGRSERTWLECLKLRDSYPDLVYVWRHNRSGIGATYRRGIIEATKLFFEKSDWIVLSAADLPFGLSDIRNIGSNGSRVYTGSKAHPKSMIEGRSMIRNLASSILSIINKYILGIKAKDTQGTYLLPLKVANYLLTHIQSNNFFFTVELAYWAERLFSLEEVPVRYVGESRQSRISLFRVGFSVLWNCCKFFWRLKLYNFQKKEAKPTYG